VDWAQQVIRNEPAALTAAARKGVPPGGLYEFYGDHPEEAQWFARAMGRVTSLLVSELATAKFRPLATGRVVDVGGSRGTLLAHLLQAAPEATGVLFDRPEALAEAPQFLAAAKPRLLCCFTAISANETASPREPAHLGRGNDGSE
jgi:hypothetical protein